MWADRYNRFYSPIDAALAFFLLIDNDVNIITSGFVVHDVGGQKYLTIIHLYIQYSKISIFGFKVLNQFYLFNT
ncbi:hypothetical protein RclHR1_06650001 [Rhizophagus clarus]|uniref:Uncharacterized protein n=1 Tax=Rhizophagus clarus TaxID=94130 RepID=A0A2Z6RV45_9GLOM|nr:hypothetical protein RclHR1_06650001 [Rhizophagus clarus]